MSANDIPPDLDDDEDHDDDGELDVEWYPVPDGLIGEEE